ncbi:MAG: SDR family oxidoreductase [Chitinophagaceae bacterium]|nr:SDR family oxidoreductase [Chitinophagaceae bacterium]
MNKQSNKVAVVTGGSSGIGLATAKELIAEGAKVIITGRNQKAVEDTAKEIGAIGFVSDQSSISDIDVLATKTKTQFGKIDILVINAGVYSIVPFESVSESSYDSSMNINVKGVFFTLQKFVPLLNEGASVILISSVGAYSAPASAHSVYSATKAAVNSLVRSISFELAPKGIRVNAVCPGPTETPIFGKIGLPQEALQQMAGAIQNKIPAKRFGAPSDIAKLISFISSDDASFITGSEYVIDGGISSVPIMS